jgi:hypothetical protein
MNPQSRIAVIILALGIVAGLSAMLFVRDASVPGDSRLEGSIALFMKNCLPDELTDAQREEIDGIMTRFNASAAAGRIYPQEIAAVEDELNAYIERGEITRLELNDFMMMVGNATRRMDEEYE